MRSRIGKLNGYGWGFGGSSDAVLLFTGAVQQPR